MSRVVHPTYEERQRWINFVDLAAKHAQELIDWHAEAALLGRKPSDPVPVAVTLFKQRRRLSKTPLPENQQQVGSPLHRLYRLIEAWEALDLDQRGDRQSELKDLAGLVIGQIAPKRAKDD